MHAMQVHHFASAVRQLRDDLEIEGQGGKHGAVAEAHEPA